MCMHCFTVSSGLVLFVLSKIKDFLSGMYQIGEIQL